MVHGLGGSALNWMAVGPGLAESYHPLAIDLAGFGRTPLFRRTATVGANTKLVHDFIARVAGRPAMLMGNSMGGHIAILEAAAHPESVTSMVLVNPAIPGPHVRRPEPRMLGAMAALSVPGLAQMFIDRRVRSLGPEGLVERALELVCADASRIDPVSVEAHVQLTREREHLGPQNARAFIQATRSIALHMADPRFWSRVAAVKAPTLILHGSVDRLIPVAAARELHRRRPDWELEVFEGIGHVPMLETPDLFLDALTSWTATKIPSAAAAS
jgi:pimeloyl-ACP methyl ester carboxylesterase